MAGSAEPSLKCGPCTVSRKDVHAISWCLECEEGLCTDCLEHHRRMKITRGHMTIDAKEYENLPAFVHKISPNCSEHNKKLELFCSVHNVPCCVQCLGTNHSKCIGVTSLEDVTSSIKKSPVFSDAERDVESLLEDLDKVSRSRSNNVNRIQEEESRIRSDISQIKAQLNEYIDGLEAKCLTGLNNVKEKEIKKIESVLNNVCEKRKALVALQKDIKGIKLHASDLQAYLGQKHIESHLTTSKAFVTNLNASDGVSDVDISFETSPSVRLIMGKLTTFGKIIATSVRKPAQHPVRRAQSVVTPRGRGLDFKTGITSLTTIPEVQNTKKPDQSPDIRKASLLYQRKLHFPIGQFGVISSITRLHDKRILVTDSTYKNGHMYLLSPEGKFMKEIKIVGDPWDVSQIDDATIAVTYPDEKIIRLVNLSSGDVIDTIPLTRSGWCISSDNDAIWVGLKGNEIHELDLYGNKLNSIKVKCRLEQFHMISDRIYLTDPKKNKLYCVSPVGELVWEYQNEYMRGPQGVSTDKYGNIFVTCGDNHSIIAISPDRNKIRILLGKSVGLERPNALYIDKESSVLLVSNRNGKFAALYKILYR